MNWLQATLAFALVMLVLATIVAVVLEAGYRALSVRERGFRIMMERIFDEILVPRAAHRLEGVSVAAAREGFISAVTRNEGYERRPGRLRTLVQSGSLSSMTMMQFADRLADTEIGRAIAQARDDRVETMINDLAQKFERFGSAASQRFKQQANSWCICASLVVAFVANIDAVRVFESLLRDDDLTNAVIAQYGRLVADAEPRPEDRSDAALEIPDDIERVRRNVAAAQAQMADLYSTGLPVTADVWPFCTGVAGSSGNDTPPEQASEPGALPRSTPSDRKCLAVASLRHWSPSEADPREGWRQVLARIFGTSAGYAWLASVVLGGLLIGLGAPFWFDLARGLTRTTTLLRTAGAADSGQRPVATPFPASGPSPPPRTPVEAFKVAIAAATQRAPAGPSV